MILTEGWESVSKFADCLSPVPFTDELVESDNTGQVFMASRFVFSPTNEFDSAKDFADAIATNRYAPKEPEKGANLEIKRATRP